MLQTGTRIVRENTTRKGQVLNPSGFVIRLGVKADLGAIQRIDVLSFPPEEQYHDAFYSTIWEGTRYRPFVAVTATDDVVAYALLDFITETARLRSMAVHPDYRRCGLGTTLLRHAVGSISNEVDLFVNADNLSAQHLYTHLGFIVEKFISATNQLTMRLPR